MLAFAEISYHLARFASDRSGGAKGPARWCRMALARTPAGGTIALEAQIMTVATPPFRGPMQQFHIPLLGSAPVLIALATTALAAVLVFAVSLPTTRDPSVASDILATADAIDQHAQAMTQDGQTLADHAKAIESGNRLIWLAIAQHMISDGGGLRSMAEQLRATAKVLGDEPTHRANANPSTLSAQADGLRTDGQAAIDHGRAMVGQAAIVAELAARPGSGITDREAALMGTDANRIIDAGQRIVALAVRLDTDADQLRRALGR